MATMKAAIFVEKNRSVLDDKPIPEVVKNDDSVFAQPRSASIDRCRSITIVRSAPWNSSRTLRKPSLL